MTSYINESGKSVASEEREIKGCNKSRTAEGFLQWQELIVAYRQTRPGCEGVTDA